MNCRPFLPSQYFTIASCFVWCVFYVVNILLTSNLNVLSSLYFSSVSQLNAGCFMACLPIFGPAMLCGLSAAAAAISCIAALVVSATALTIISLAIVYWLAIVIVCFCMPKWDFLLLTPCSISCLNEDKSYWCLYICLLLSTKCFVLSIIYKCTCLYVQWWCNLLKYIGGSYWLLIILWWMCYLYRSDIMLYSQH